MKYFCFKEFICKDVEIKERYVTGKIFLRKKRHKWGRFQYDVWIKCFIEDVIAMDDGDLYNIVKY